MSALIGSTGLIGRVLKHYKCVDNEYNSENIRNLQSHDCLIVAAPTSNRLWANNNVDADLKNTELLIDCLDKNKPNRIVLIGTVDSLHMTHTAYGRHRKFLEDYVKTNIANHHVVRLCTLIHPWISKNILYDLKNKKFLHSINPALVAQWYDLDRLADDLNKIINLGIKEVNLVSKPILTRDILDHFFPDLSVGPDLPARPYDLICAHGLALGESMNYVMDKPQVFQSIKKYLQ